MANSKLIVVEGPQGAGKTTVTDYIRHGLKYTNLYRLCGTADSSPTGKQKAKDMYWDLLEYIEKMDKDSAKAVWVPNRNGLFLNIAACFADSKGYDYIIIGANKEEAGTFPDNGVDFLDSADSFFEFSTLMHPKILAPLKNLYKHEIINLALEKGSPLEYLKSCYNSSGEYEKKHCGKCESCKRLRDAILKSVNKDLLKLFF